MVLIFGLVGMAIAAVATFNRIEHLEPSLAGGVTSTIKRGVVQSIVSGIADLICAMLGIRSQPRRVGRFTTREIDE